MEESSKSSKIFKIFEGVMIFVVIIVLIIVASIFFMNIGKLEYYEIILISILLGIEIYLAGYIIFKALTDILDI